jgi:hypothetical protein
MITKSQLVRLVTLDQQIRGGSYPNSHRFAVDYEVSVRTIKRDIEFMKDQLEAPVAYDTERRGYYYTQKEWVMSFKLLQDEVLPISTQDIKNLTKARSVLLEIKRPELADTITRLMVLHGSDPIHPSVAA